MANKQPAQAPIAQVAVNEKLKLAMLIVAAMLLVGILSAIGTWWLMEQRLPQVTESTAAEPLPAAPPIYENLDPPFVVNLKQGGQSRYLQVGIALMGRHSEELSALKAHLPLLRSRLLILFSGQDLTQLSSAEGKEQLRQQATREVQEVAQQVTGMPVVEQVLFTGLVVQ